jgi:WD40 repeat protein
VADLEEVPITQNQTTVECSFAEAESQSASYFLWAIPGQGGRIWDTRSNQPLPLPGFAPSDIRSCTVSPDRSRFVVARKDGSAELWSLSGNRVADLATGGGSKGVDWTLQGSAVKLERMTGEIMLFDLDGKPLVRFAPTGSVSGFSFGMGDVSFDPLCKHAVLWTPDGRVLKYTKKLRVFDLPYSIPIFWQRTNDSCGE